MMDNLPEDQKVVNLLTKLKRSNGAYPSEMLEARRRAYIKQVANAGLGIGIGAALKNAAKGGSKGGGAASTTVASKILETALIAAIAFEAGTVTYIYRDKIAHAVRSYVNTPAVQEVTAPPDEKTSNSALVEVIKTPSATPSATPSGTPSGTPTQAFDLAGNNNGGTNAGVNANGTPNPNGNNGNQYGLTPKPARTRENNNNNGDGSGGGGNNGNNNGGSHNQP